MPYTLFLYFTGFFCLLGTLLGTSLIYLAYRHRVALRSIVKPLNPRLRPQLLHPVSIDVPTAGPHAR
ncbi:MAG: hypothetical protein VW625_06850 [Perlucidibaca sp.]